MKYKLFIICGCLLMSISVFAQQSLEELLAQAENLNFNELVTLAEQYFEQKQTITGLEETITEVLRDDEFTKFMRWKNYWGGLLNPDGTLGDPTAYWQSQLVGGANLEENSSPYADVPWTNISHQNYMDNQIGMGRTTSIAFHPTDPKTFYVGAAIGGIWKTTDGGKSYIPLGDNLPFMAVSSIVVDQANPNTIYIAISDVISSYPYFGLGVYKSIDSGLNWSPTALKFGFSDITGIHNMEADPRNSKKIFVATSEGLYRTDDGFVTVKKVNVNTEAYSTRIFDIKFKPGDSNVLYVGGYYGDFYKSTDGGDNFSKKIDVGSEVVHLVVNPIKPFQVYLGNKNKLYPSTDGGETFNNVETLPESDCVFAFTLNNENFLLVGNVNLYISGDNGNNFSLIGDWKGNNAELIHADQRNILINPLEGNYAYICNDGGVYKYNIADNEFENLSDGLIITQYYDIAVAQTLQNVISGGTQDNGSIFRDNDEVWNYYISSGDGMNQEIDFTNADIRYWAYQYGVIHRRQNGIDKVITPPEQKYQEADDKPIEGKGAWQTPFRLDPNNPYRIVAAYDRVYRSSNRGDTWDEISPVWSLEKDTRDKTTLSHLAIAPSNSERIYVTGQALLYVKNINNNEWALKPLTPLALAPFSKISDLEVDFYDMNTIYISITGFVDKHKVFKSTDAGDTWENISELLPNVSTGAIETYNRQPGGLFVGTDAGVYYKDDNLVDWQEYGELPHTRIRDIEIQYGQLDANWIRVATYGRGIFEAPFEVKNTSFPIIGDELSTDLWSAGWTTAEFYTINEQTYLFLMKKRGYSSSSSNVIIHKMNTDGTVGDLVTEYTWSEGWTKSEFFRTPNGQLHLFLLKERGYSNADTNAEIYQINIDGTIGNLVKGSKWSQGWTTTEFFKSNGLPYLFLLKKNGYSNAGYNAQVYKINASGKIGDLVEGYNWSEGWTTATPFYIGNKTYFLFLKKEGQSASRTNVQIHEMNADGSVGELVDEQNWSEGWTSAEIVKSEGRNYLLTLKANVDRGTRHNVYVYEINGNATVGKRIEAHKWTDGWTTAEFFPNILDQPNRLFLLKAATGNVSIHNIR